MGLFDSLYQPRRTNPDGTPVQDQQGGAFSLSPYASLISSIFAPSQSQQQPEQYQPPPPTSSVPQYLYGPTDEQDAGQESKAFASNIGQGVLAASQNALKQGQQKKRLGQPQQQSEADPYSSVNSGGGWNVGGLSGVDYT